MDDQHLRLEESFIKKQKEICRKYNAVFQATPFNKIIGVALQSFETFNMPINGLRHPKESDGVVNWYIWTGDYSNRADFFQPLHVSHLLEVCPKAINYLGLAPGWRFLFDGEYEDVWFDESLLVI